MVKLAADLLPGDLLLPFHNRQTTYVIKQCRLSAYDHVLVTLSDGRLIYLHKLTRCNLLGG